MLNSKSSPDTAPARSSLLWALLLWIPIVLSVLTVAFGMWIQNTMVDSHGRVDLEWAWYVAWGAGAIQALCCFTLLFLQRHNLARFALALFFTLFQAVPAFIAYLVVAMSLTGTWP
jgi:hypothetical protein